MPFIYKIISPDEKLLGLARLHWIYILNGLIWFALSVAIGVFFRNIVFSMIGDFYNLNRIAFAVPFMIGAFSLIYNYIKYISTELGLTTERIIYKKGLIFTTVREIDLEEFKSATINNGLLGRFLNYGYFHLDARFITDINLPAFADPYRFMKAFNEMRGKIKDDSMHVIVDHAGANALQNANVIEHNNATNHQIEHRPDKNDGTHYLNDDRYESMSGNPAQNIMEVASELKTQKDEIKQAQPKKSPSIFRNKNNSDRPQKREVFIHTDALHDKVIDAFTDAEENVAKS